MADRAEPYSVPASSIPSQFGEAVQRKAEHFEVLLDLLKLFALAPAGGATIEPVLRDQAQAAVAKGDAILAGARAPDAGSGGSDA